VSAYVPIEPYEDGMLDVGDGQVVHWETSGNPAGRPAILLHGGPGGGSHAGMRGVFDPTAYSIVQFDQRGCGRSTPSVSDLATNLTTNTTDHLIADMEALREHLGIQRWLVSGVSWGVTLGLAYAERHPERVTELVFMSVTLTRPSDVHWLYHEAGRFFPEEWQRFQAGVPEDQRGGDLVAAYNRLLNEEHDPEVRERAAKDWCAWEDAVVSLEDGWTPSQRFKDPAYRMTFARLCAHYFSHAGWLEDNALLPNAHRLAGIPGVLVHGSLDIQGPPEMAWLLAQAWPDARLHLLRTGHRGGAEVFTALRAATDEFARRSG
jgi:proline iminopeptidase